MKEYKCLMCGFHFCSSNGMSYCPACECENLEDITFDDSNLIKQEEENHHIHPRFMDNKKGKGQQFLMDKKTHSILHWKIVLWIWEEIPEKLRKDIIKKVIIKSKKFIGVE